MGKLKDDKKAKEEEAAKLLVALHHKAKTVGNYVHESVPISNNEDNNETVKTWAPEDVKVEHKPDVLPHHGVLTRLDGYDPERGVKIVGHRGYCLTGYGLFLNLAVSYASTSGRKRLGIGQGLIEAARQLRPRIPLQPRLYPEPAALLHAEGCHGQDGAAERFR
jgi:hypothetical protein